MTSGDSQNTFCHNYSVSEAGHMRGLDLLFPMVHHHWSCYLAKPLACVVFHYYLHKWGFSGGLDGKESAAVQETWVWFLGQEDPLEKRMATHSSILAWRFPWTEEPGGLCVCVYKIICTIARLNSLPAFKNLIIIKLKKINTTSNPPWSIWFCLTYHPVYVPTRFWPFSFQTFRIAGLCLLLFVFYHFASKIWKEHPLLSEVSA